MRILDLIQRDHEPLAVVTVKQAVGIGVGIWVDLGNHALVVRRPAQALELVGGRFGRSPDLVDTAPAALRLGDRPLPVDLFEVGHL